MRETKWKLDKSHRYIVGSSAQLDGLDAMSYDVADVIELRIDLILAGEKAPCKLLPSMQLPVMLTLRGEEEGGAVGVSQETMQSIFYDWVEGIQLLDVELARHVLFEKELSIAKDCGVVWVASFHDFEKVPSLDDLRLKAFNAKALGADVFKVAARCHTVDDIKRLVEFQQMDLGIALATMGMGPLAPASRLLCMQYGSVLNYGYLGNEATAPGQWSAYKLNEAKRLMTFMR